MTSERAQAYGRVMRTIEAMGPTKLHDDERETVRDAADTLLFCEDLSGEPGAADALADVRRLLDALVESERWVPETAERLRGDLEACGPLALSGR